MSTTLPDGSTVTPAFFPLSLQQLANGAGCPALGGSVAFYDASTTAARPVYQDAALTQAFASPVPVDGFGRLPAIFVGAGPYRFVLMDGAGSQIGGADNVPGGTVTPPVTSTTAPAFVTGDIKAAYSTNQQDGFVIANGLTIGDSGSSATSRASGDCNPLFVLLWNTDLGLAITPNRGATASADWAAKKTIALPDLRGRGLRGCDAMGSGSRANVLTTATAGTGGDAVGQRLGAETVALTLDQLPVTTPTITVDAGVTSPGKHTHTAQTANAGGHTHNTTEAPHTHSLFMNSTSGASLTPNNGNTQVANYSPSTIGVSSSLTGLTVNAVADHAHAATVDNGQAGGSHTHVATCAPFGSGNAHANIPPDTLIYYHIKL